MSPRPNHPAPLSDAQLLAYIEDELDAQGAGSVERALRDNPPLERRVRAMRADRAALHDSLGMIHDERAPRDLIVSALQTVERTALLASAVHPALTLAADSAGTSSEGTHETLATAPREPSGGPEGWTSDDFSRLPPAPPALARSRRPAVWRFVSSRPLAAAAGFALLVGGAVLVASVMTSRDARGLRSLGDADLARSLARSSPSAPDLAAGKSLQESVKLAIADGAARPETDSAEAGNRDLGAGAAGAAARLEGTADASITGSNPVTRSANALAKAGTAEAEGAAPAVINVPPISIERATQLAAENRLAIRVVPRAKSDASKLSAGLAALAKRDASRSWRLNTKPTPEFASSVLAQLGTKGRDSGTSIAEAKDRSGRDDPRDPNGDLERALGAIAESGSRSGAHPGAGVPTLQPIAPIAAPFAARADHSTATAEVYHAEIVASPAALAGLRSALDRAGDVEIVYEELAAPATLAPALIEQNVLWWTQPASAWVRRSTVPIIVEPGS